MENSGSLYVKSCIVEDVKAWASQVQVGQKLNPKDKWNENERWGNRLDVPSEVFGVKHSPSQTGIQFKVRTKEGAEHWLDAAWFYKPASA